MGAIYDLGLIKSLVTQNRYLITRSALQTALEIGFDDADIVECIVEELAESHFYKTMPATTVKAIGLWQDVYRIYFRSQHVYLKLQINAQTKAVIISFKEDASFF
jgi:motility quorum-sensing regulator / GCU-specific mRNA interferase toxin